MLEARRVGLWKGRYDIISDGQPIATWYESPRITGGTLEWRGRRYHLWTNLSSGTAGMAEGEGRRVATAHDVGRKNWTIEADGTTYSFRRAGPWRQEEKLHVQGRRAGAVRRTNVWRGDIAADLPGLPLAVALFALTLVLSMWRAAAAW